MAISRDRYSTVAIILHWLIALLILTNIGVAWYFNTLHGAAKIEPVQLHKSFGITVLLLSTLRLGWRLAVPAPKLPSYVTGWEKWLAQAVHVGFYVIMFGMPLTGWALSSASPLIRVRPITLYGLPWPAIGPLASLPPDQMKAAHQTFVAAHGLIAKAIYLLLAIHVGAVLRHLLLLRDGVGARMIPFARAGSS